MNAIETTGLTKKYKDLIAVDRLDLNIKEGELFSLLGVNGAGKTTTIKMLCGLTSPTAGDARIAGKSILTEIAAVKECIAVSPQETAVAPNLTAKENLMLMARLHDLSKDQSQDMISELSRRLGLGEIMGRKAKKLSGGWQRRLSIAMALVCRPQILFLDEPTLGLDVIARSELWDVIRGLKNKTTIVLTTHYMEEAAALADRVGIMKNGRLLKCGTVEEIITETGAANLEDAFVTLVKERTI